MKFSTQYDHHRTPGLACKDESRTQQQYLEDADINNILRAYANGNAVPGATAREPIFGDFSDEAISDFHQAMRTIQGVAQLMQELPAKTRSRFQNNPAAILDFVRDPANIAEAMELGLVDPKIDTPPATTDEPPKAAK